MGHSQTCLQPDSGAVQHAQFAASSTGNQLTPNHGGLQGKLSLKPVLKLVGAELDGGDLLLHANVSADRRSLVALTPASQLPLSAGDHPLKLSLNGQFSEQAQKDLVRSLPLTLPHPGCMLFSDFASMNASIPHQCVQLHHQVEGLTCVVILPADPTKIPVLSTFIEARHVLTVRWCLYLQVLSVQGPSIRIAQPYVHAAAAIIQVPVTLTGPNMLPVTANISVSQRILSQGELHPHMSPSCVCQFLLAPSGFVI